MGSSFQSGKQTKQILVLGHKGMLGRAVCKYFEYHSKYEVITCPYRAPSKAFSKFIRDNFLKVSAIINCIGAIPQKTKDFSINYQLPQFLARLSLEGGNQLYSTKIIHPTTDCEFSGDQYDFNVDGLATKDFPDPKDDYGRSKVLGSKAIVDNKAGYVIRSSIVGLSEGYLGKSLLDWAASQLAAGNTIKGYVNAKWNGITVLEWAKAAHAIIESGPSFGSPSGDLMLQIGTEKISKYDLLCKFQKVFQLGGKIELVSQPTCFRWLKHEFDYPNRVPFIEYQLNEYKTFLESEGRNIFSEQEWS